jgi:hypothetical protein
MAAQSEVGTVFNRSSTGIVGSNPAREMDACPHFYVVLSWVGSGLTTGWFPLQGVLPNVQK